MGEDVENTLSDILERHGLGGAATLSSWKRDGRVRKDVY